MREKRQGRETLALLAWGVAAVLLVGIFLRGHPPRPAFSGPTPSAGGPFPAAPYGAAIGTALAYAATLAGAGRGLRRLLAAAGGTVAEAFALGALYASLLALALLGAGLFRTWTFAPLLLAPVVAGSVPRRGGVNVAPADAWRIAAAALAFFALADLLVLALAPLTANDPIVYHMPLARGYATTGGLAGAPDLVYARMPHAGDLLFAGAYLFGGEAAARVFHVLLAAAAAAMAAAIARTVRPGASGLPAAALFLTLPIVLDPRTVGNVDLAAALFFGAALLAAGRRSAGAGRGELAAAALLGGGMLTVKYSTAFAYPLLAAALVFPVFRRGALLARGRDLATFALISAAAVLPWLVKAAAETGNPFFPLFPSALGGRGWDSVLADRLVRWQRSIGPGRTLGDWVLLPWNVVFRGQPRYAGFDGVLSPALLLWVFWAVKLGGRTPRRLLLLCLAGLFLWGAGSQQLRFLMPVTLLVAATAGAFARPAPGRSGAVVGAFFLVAAAILAAPALRETKRDTLPVVLGRESAASYLDRKVQSHEAFRAITGIVPEGDVVALAWENRIYYCPRPWIADSFFEASRLARLAESAGAPHPFLAALRAEGAAWALVNRPLERVFAPYAAGAPGVMDRAWEECPIAGTWKGIELRRIPPGPAIAIEPGGGR